MRATLLFLSALILIALDIVTRMAQAYTGGGEASGYYINLAWMWWEVLYKIGLALLALFVLAPIFGLNKSDDDSVTFSRWESYAPLIFGVVMGACSWPYIPEAAGATGIAPTLRDAARQTGDLLSEAARQGTDMPNYLKELIKSWTGYNSPDTIHIAWMWLWKWVGRAIYYMILLRWLKIPTFSLLKKGWFWIAALIIAALWAFIQLIIIDRLVPLYYQAEGVVASQGKGDIVRNLVGALAVVDGAVLLPIIVMIGLFYRKAEGSKAAIRWLFAIMVGMVGLAALYLAVVIFVPPMVRMIAMGIGALIGGFAVYQGVLSSNSELAQWMDAQSRLQFQADHPGTYTTGDAKIDKDTGEFS